MLPGNFGLRPASLPLRLRLNCGNCRPSSNGQQNMRALLGVFTLLLAGCISGAVRADHAPSFIVSGKPGVPVVINGYDASWGIVEGDWGLYRPGHMRLTVTYAPQLIHPWPTGGYYPYTGRRPRSGRLEIRAPHRPHPGPTFRRVWSTQSDPGLLSEYPPFDPPPVILAPRSERLLLNPK